MTNGKQIIHLLSDCFPILLIVGTGANKINNEYNMHFSHDGYGHLFNDFDIKHRIDINRLDKWDEDIGKGHYGTVYKGQYTLPNGERMLVAYKTFQEDRAGSVGDFLREAKVMSHLDHPRVVQFVGVHYGVTNQPLLVTKYMANGDLLRYMRDQNRIITLNQLLNFCLQAAEGMEYLHSRNYIHRHLEARNCLLDEKLNICLADFGLSRESTINDSYEMLNSRLLPIKLLSLEAMDGHVSQKVASKCTLAVQFSFKSDVWAFGNLMWEVTTRGWVPWEGESNTELKQKLLKGQRLEQPEYCPNQIYRQIMLPCWAEARDDRPSFTDIIIDMNKIIQVLRAQEALRMNTNITQKKDFTKTIHSTSGGSSVLFNF
uniref:receptor protein-tyrosine kinase n=1 Tax=Steinernema glaseri TaxID=37863 RepID=A0A1I8AJ28_9BILA